MYISFECPECRSELEMDARDAPSGSKVSCPQCDSSVTVPRHKLGPGVTLGNFTIVGIIGRGAMGEVYLAEQTSMERKVALKILPPQLAVLDDSIDRFRQEVRMAARVEHPNLVPAFEAGEDSGIHYLAMAFVDGDSLDRYVQKQGPLPEKEALGIIKKVAGGLAQAWQRHHLMHRDVKPGNIIMDKYGEPRLTDLGLAKSLDDAQQVTMTAMSIGTPNYMSPEQVEGRADVDQRSDIYGLGTTLYHLLTGEIPFGGSSVSETLRRQLTEHLPDPRKYAPGVSKMCVDLLELMLAKDRDNRYQSYEDLIGDIDLVLAQQPPSKSPLEAGKSIMIRAGHEKEAAKKRVSLSQSKAERLRHLRAERINAAAGKTRKKSKWPAVASGAAVALLLVAGVVVGILGGRDGDSRGVAPEPSPKPGTPPVKVAMKTEDNEPPPAKEEQTDEIKTELREIQSLVNNNPDKIEEGLARLRAVRDQGLEAPLLKKVDRAVSQMESRIQARRERLRMASAEEGKAGKETPKQKDAHPVAEEESTSAVPQVADASESEKDAAAVPDEKDIAGKEREKLLAELADSLLTRDLKTAQRRLESARRSEAVRAMGEEWKAMEKVAGEVLSMRKTIMASFKKHRGRQIPVHLKSGTAKLRIDGVDPGRIRASKVITSDGRVVGSAGREFGYADLSIKEKMKRLGPEKTPPKEIMRGLLAAEAGADEYRRRYFERADCPLARLLLKRETQVRAQREAALAARRKARLEAGARRAFAKILAAANLPRSPDELDRLVETVRKRRFGEQQCERIKSRVSSFRERFSATDCAAANERLLKVLGLIRPGMVLYVDKAAVEKVVKKLNELNPNCGVKMGNFEIADEGVVAKLGGNNLTDISPLSRLPVVSIHLKGTAVANLMPLADLPLHSVYYNAGDYHHPPPHILRLSHFAFLHDCPLKHLHYRGPKANSIEGFDGMPLEELIIRDTELVSHHMNINLHALRNARLEKLVIMSYGVDHMKIRNLESLAGMPLRHLDVHGPAERMRGHHDLGYVHIEDWSVLEKFPLEVLRIYNSDISDISFLEDHELKVLDLQGSKIDSLRHLKGMPLEDVCIARTAVSDLTPLKGMPLKHLNIAGTKVTDVSPLLDCPLESLNISGTKIKNISLLNKIPTLKKIDR